MNKEQLLETLKGLTTAIESGNNTASSEDLYQSFYAGIRYVLDELRHMDCEEKEVNWSISSDSGADEYGSLAIKWQLSKEFLRDVGNWNDTFEVKSEKYVEQLPKTDIATILNDIGLACDPPAQPTTTETTNPETPNA